MTCATSDITIQKGSTFTATARWETTPIVYRVITGITKAAPAVVTAVGHGVPDGWRVAVTNVVGMRQINAKHTPPSISEYTPATYISADTFSLNAVNAAGFTAYASGGVLQYNTPQDFASYTARMTIKNAIGGTALVTLTDASGLTLDNTNKTIGIQITAVLTAALSAGTGVYDLEMVSTLGVVTKILTGDVLILGEVTT